MGRTSSLDAQIWVERLRKLQILQFEYKDLPTELKNKYLLRRSREEGFIRKVDKNDNGRNIWRLTDKKYKGIKVNKGVKLENNEMHIENNEIENNEIENNEIENNEIENNEIEEIENMKNDML